MADTPELGGSGAPAPSEPAPIWERPEDLSFPEPRPIPSFDSPPVMPSRAEGPEPVAEQGALAPEQQPQGQEQQPQGQEQQPQGQEQQPGAEGDAPSAPQMPGFATPPPAPPEPEPEAPAAEAEGRKPKKKRRWWLWVGCGCVVVVLIAAGVFVALGGLTIFGLDLVMKGGLPRIERAVAKDPAYLQLMSDLTRIKAGQTQAVYDSTSRRFKDQTPAEDWNTQVGSIPVLIGWTSVADPTIEHQLVKNEQLGDLELAVIRLDLVQGSLKERFEFQYVKEDGQYKLMYVGKATQ
jgi:hypothetical protein